MTLSMCLFGIHKLETLNVMDGFGKLSHVKFFEMQKIGNVCIEGLCRGHQKKNQQKKVTSSEDRTGDLCHSSLMLSSLS